MAADELRHNITEHLIDHESNGNGNGHGPNHESQELALWEKWVIHDAPDAFGPIELDKGGGFSEVKDLYKHTRWASAAMLICFVLYNVFAVARLDYALMMHPHLAAERLGTPLSAIDKFYFSRAVSDAIFPYFGYAQDEIPSPVSIIGCLELLGLSFFVLLTIYESVKVATCQGFKKWYAVQAICWELLPTMSVYSAMRLLNVIVPAVASASLLELVSKIKERHDSGKSWLGALSGTTLDILQFVASALFAGVVGFDTFLMRLRIVSASANNNYLTPAVFLSTVQFLVQILGIVRLGWFVRKRLFVFIFGGEDGVMQDCETVRMNTWNALIAKRAYEDLKFYEFVAVMLSFSDQDFQSLVFNEKAEEEAPLDEVHDWD